MDATREEWRPVIGYEGHYEVSSLGRVRSVDRVRTVKGGFQRRYRGQILRPWTRDSGHQIVSLGHRDRHPVHRLVAMAFVGKPDPDQECRHLNGNPADNRADNLAWGDRSDQRRDDVRNGVHFNASLTHCRRGHEFTPANTYVIPSTGSRQCRACARAFRAARKKERS